jgi:hypothetical protein
MFDVLTHCLAQALEFQASRSSSCLKVKQAIQVLAGHGVDTAPVAGMLLAKAVMTAEMAINQVAALSRWQAAVSESVATITSALSRQGLAMSVRFHVA